MLLVAKQMEYLNREVERIQRKDRVSLCFFQLFQQF